MTFTDTRGYFISEASVYRLLKAHDLIASPAFVVIKAADEFREKTTGPNQLWQTDFTYLNGKAQTGVRVERVRGREQPNDSFEPKSLILRLEKVRTASSGR